MLFGNKKKRALKELKNFRKSLLSSYTVADIGDDNWLTIQNAINRADIMRELEKIDDIYRDIVVNKS